MRTTSFLRGSGLLAVAAAAASISASAFAATALQPVDLNWPGYAATQPWDVADNGTVVGVSDSVGFIYSGGVFTSFVHPDANLSTTLTGIAADGTLVGTYWFGDVDDPTVRGFVYAGGSFSDFVVPGASWTVVRHISTSGRYITGDWRDAGGVNNGFAFDRSTLALTLFPVGDGLTTIVQGVNDQGLVTGSFIRNDGAGGPSVSGGFVHDLVGGGRTEVLDVNGEARPRFRDINNAGEIVGFVGANAFAGILGDWALTTPPAGFTMAAYGNNNTGTVVGYYLDDTTGLASGWISSPVPEPGPAALLALGLAALSLRWRRRP